jgi:hypothetical protein
MLGYYPELLTCCFLRGQIFPWGLRFRMTEVPSFYYVRSNGTVSRMLINRDSKLTFCRVTATSWLLHSVLKFFPMMSLFRLVPSLLRHLTAPLQIFMQNESKTIKWNVSFSVSLSLFRLSETSRVGYCFFTFRQTQQLPSSGWKRGKVFLSHCLVLRMRAINSLRSKNEWRRNSQTAFSR